MPPPLLCTYENCAHQRTWATREDRRADMAAHPDWCEPATGDATCVCHWPAAQPTFPCDQQVRGIHQ